MPEHIIELFPETYLAPWYGEPESPARTDVKKDALRFSTYFGAALTLRKIRKAVRKHNLTGKIPLSDFPLIKRRTAYV